MAVFKREGAGLRRLAISLEAEDTRRIWSGRKPKHYKKRLTSSPEEISSFYFEEAAKKIAH